METEEEADDNQNSLELAFADAKPVGLLAGIGQVNVQNFVPNHYFAILGAVAAADAVIAPEEIKKIGDLLVLIGLGPEWANALCERAMASIENPLGFLNDVKVPSKIAKLYVRDALFLAYSDGEVHDQERQLIQRVAAKLRVSESLEDLEALVKKSHEVGKLHERLFLGEV